MDQKFENDTPEVQENQTENTYGDTNEGASYSNPYVDSASSDPNAGAAYTNPYVDSANNDQNVNAGGPYSDPNAGATYSAPAGTVCNNPNAGASYTYGTPVNKPEERKAADQNTAQSYSYGNTEAGQADPFQNQQFQNTPNYEQQWSQNNPGYGQPQGNSNYNTYNNPNNQGTGNSNDGFDNAPLSMGEFVLIDILALIPCVGIIVCLIWAFGSSGNINRRNLCRAHLIAMAVVIVINIIFTLIIVSALMSVMPYMY
ncbi:hypothetical protein ABXS75_10400 [Roseburia hominis]